MPVGVIMSEKQQQFDYSNDNAIVVPRFIYDMSWEEFIASGHSVTYTEKDIHDGVAKKERGYVTDDVIFAVQQLYDTRSMTTMTGIRSSLAKLGCSIFEAKFEKLYDETVEIRKHLYDANYTQYKEIFGSADNRKRASRDQRGGVNVAINCKKVRPTVLKYAAYIGCSRSMIVGAFVEEGLLRWDGLAPEARPGIEKDLAVIDERFREVADACFNTVVA